MKKRHNYYDGFFSLVGYVEEDYGGLYKAPTKEESDKLREERDQIKF